MIADIQIDVRDVIQAHNHLRHEMPFVTSLAINESAKIAQADQRRKMLMRFTVRRRTWVERNVKISPFSTKNRLEAIIKIDPPGGRSDILSKFEDGGVKKARDGGRLAIPVEARRGKTGVVGRAQRPKAFNFELVGRGPKATVYRGDRRTFMIRGHDGKTGGIYQRTSSGGGSRKGARLASDITTRRVRDLRIRTLYRFTEQASIDSRLELEETVTNSVRASFATTFAEAFDRVIRAGRTANIGRHRGQVVIGASKAARRIARMDVLR